LPSLLVLIHLLQQFLLHSRILHRQLNTYEGTIWLEDVYQLLLMVMDGKTTNDDGSMIKVLVL
jgi:hypothetical protein